MRYVYDFIENLLEVYPMEPLSLQCTACMFSHGFWIAIHFILAKCRLPLSNIGLESIACVFATEADGSLNYVHRHLWFYIQCNTILFRLL
jgi:hypothetical protein